VSNCHFYFLIILSEGPRITLKDVDQDYVEGFAEMLPDEYKKGGWTIVDDNQKECIKYDVVDRETLSNESMQFLMRSEEDYGRLLYILGDVGRVPIRTKGDGNCFFRAVLQQIKHNSTWYKPDMLRRQASLFLVKNIVFFKPLLEKYLIGMDMNIVSYILNMASGYIWGDDMMAMVISRMWNIRISVCAPVLDGGRGGLKHLMHTGEPDIVLCSNGGSDMSPDEATHWFATSKLLIFYYDN
jgi:hypothetical protein